MKCPKCRLINPDSAERCDCGFDFASGSMEGSYLTERQLRHDNKGRKSFWNRIWPAIYDRESARGAAEYGAVWSGIVALITMILVIFARLPGIDMIEAAIFAGLAYGIHKMSRTCAIIAFLLFGVELVYRYHLTGRTTASTAIIALFLVSGIRGTVQYHFFAPDRKSTA